MTLTCNTCGKEFEAARSDAKFCSQLCRTRNHRKKVNPNARPMQRRPLPDAFRAVTWDIWKSTDRLSRLIEDDRLPRNRLAIASGEVGKLMTFHKRLEDAITALDPEQGAKLAAAREIVEMSEMDRETFEAALDAAREQGDLSRTNVIANGAG